MIVFRRLLRYKPLSNGYRFLSSAGSSLFNSSMKRPLLGFSPQISGFLVSNRNDQCLFNIRCYASLPNVEPVGGMVDVPLAQTGEGIAECELLKWFVQEGEQVEEFQPLCEVQSDKATIEITSRYQGKVLHILHAPGDIVKVGETLLKLGVENYSAVTVSDRRGLLDPELKGPSNHGDLSSQASSDGEHIYSGVLCAPAVRNLARQHGIDLNVVKGTGKDGRILKEDVLNYVGGKDVDVQPCASYDSSHQVVTETSQFEDTIVKLRGFQRAMVKSMTMAARVPHFHYVEEVNCDALMKLKASFQSESYDPSIKHTFLPFLVKSLSVALSKYPLLNSSFSEELHEVLVKGSHNIGIAMATPSGLVVPNIKRVQSLSVLEITKEIYRLQQLAVDNKLSQEDVSGGTITLSNIGAIGGKIGSPLINLPEVSIIAIGRIQRVAHIADDGTVLPVSVMNVNIGADHRVIDGATVARFCNEWKSLIQKPELLLLNVR